MCKKLMMTVLVMCMLIISAKMYPYPVTCTKIKIMGTEVILLGDFHSSYGDASLSFKRKIDESNNILREWIKKLPYSSEETLFLLELNSDAMSSYEAEDLFSHRCSERSETLSFLKELAKGEPSISNLKFKYADRRTVGLKNYVLTFDLKIMKIVSDLSKGIDPVTLEAELWNIYLRQDIYGLLSGSRVLRDLENELREPGRREYFFSVTFPIVKEILCRLSARCLASGDGSPSPSAKEFLDDFMKVVRELEECRNGYAPGTPEYCMLEDYLMRINKAKERLEAFFNIYLPDRSLPYSTAFFNSMEGTKSFQPYIELNDPDKGATMTIEKDIIKGKIADAGFYIDVLNAIKSGVKRVVLYAGAAHTYSLRQRLFFDYGPSVITEEIGDIEGILMSPSISIDNLLPPSDLRRILGMP